MNHVDNVTQPTFANSVVKVKHVPAVLSEGVYGQNMCSFLSSGKTEGGSKSKKMGRVGRKSSMEAQAAVLSWVDSKNVGNVIQSWAKKVVRGCATPRLR